MAFKLYNLAVLAVCFFSFLCSIPIFVSGIWSSVRAKKTQCELIFIEIPMIVGGTIILIVSVCGIMGAQLRKKWLVWIFWFGVLVTIVLVFSFACLALVVSSHGNGGEVVRGTGFKEYRLDSYHDWLKKKVRIEKNWIGIKSCLKNRNVCKPLSQDVSPRQFFLHRLSAIQSGCCRPPTQCGFLYKSPTTYDNTFSTSSDTDCITWTNVDSLCFDCESCKAAVLENLKSDWRTVSIISFVSLILLLILWGLTSAFIYFFFLDEP